MGNYFSSNQAVKKLEDHFHLRNVNVVGSNTERVKFTTSSVVSLAKDSDTLGVLIDGKHWFGRCTVLESVWVKAIIDGDIYTYPIAKIQAPTKVNISQKRKAIGKCTLVFKVGVGAHGLRFIDCELDGHDFEHEFIFVPQYRDVKKL